MALTEAHLDRPPLRRTLGDKLLDLHLLVRARSAGAEHRWLGPLNLV
jgi:hypothetical protein